MKKMDIGWLDIEPEYEDVIVEYARVSGEVEEMESEVQ